MRFEWAFPAIFVGNLNYEDNYTEDTIVFTAMEQSNAGFYDKKFEYFGDEGEGDPLKAFEGQSHDKGGSNGVDWYLRNFWNINPTHTSYTGPYYAIFKKKGCSGTKNMVMYL